MNSMDDFQAELVGDFLLESSEGLEAFDRNLLILEKGACDTELLNEVFRVVHTIKGTAGCLGFGRIESIAHTGENVLSLMRDGQLDSSPEIADALLKLSDALRAMLELIESTGADEGGEDYSELKEILDAIKRGEFVNTSVTSDKILERESKPVEASDEAAEGWGLFDDDCAAGEDSVASEESSPTSEADTNSLEGGASWGLFEEVAEDAVNAPAASALPVPSPQKTAPTKPKAESKSNASVRVDVDVLDKLMNMVGELVLSRNQLLQLGQKDKIDPLDVQTLAQQFNQVTSELQEGVMKTRMQQIGSVWGKYPRIVRDLAQDLGKQVELETFGADTELDRTIIEAIKDPLTHIIRNAVDHGIEAPEVRKSAGKTESARLLMRAFHEGGQVNIEIIDDGAGIDGNKICGKALEKGLISVDDAARLTEREKINMIFLPGFSTAEKLSNVSGRGVGMDVVKTNIEKIGGSVDIQSDCGVGTTLRIRIPLTLAIVGALIVRCGGQRFAIPQVNIAELVRIEIEDFDTLIDYVYDQPVYNLRGKLLPLVFLDRFLGLSNEGRQGMRSVSIVVLRADGQDYGLLVDVVSDTEEIVVKPLGDQLADMFIYAGATIMGDGSVAIILDAVGIAAHSGVLGNAQKRDLVEALEEETVEDFGRKQSLILFSLAGWEHLAVPLDSAERLEEFERKEISVSGGVETILYRGTIMQLLRLSALLGLDASESDRELEQVIVYRCGERYLGIIVGMNRDVVEAQIRLESIGDRPYIKGTAVIDGDVTDVVDVDSVLVLAGLKEEEAHELCN